MLLPSLRRQLQVLQHLHMYSTHVLASARRGGQSESILVAHEGGNVQRFVPSDVLFKGMIPGGEVKDIAPIKVSSKLHKDSRQVRTSVCSCSY
jgi:hypothetical protein